MKRNRKKKKKLQSHYIYTTLLLCAPDEAASANCDCVRVTGGVKLFSFLLFMQCFLVLSWYITEKKRAIKEHEHFFKARWEIFYE